MKVVRAGIDVGFRVAYWVAHRLLRLGWAVTRPEHHGAAVAVWVDHRVLAVVHSYRRSLSFPGGGIHRGETPFDAALRELREEVGIVLEAAQVRLACEVSARWEGRLDRVHFYEATLPEVPAVTVDRREIIRAGFVDADVLIEGLPRRPLQPHVRLYLEQRRAEAGAAKN
jgi:8-oxo-dGTP pyrophosphatase MutT (NUDIX family)